MWGICVGHMRGAHVWGIYVGHMCGVYMWGICVGHMGTSSGKEEDYAAIYSVWTLECICIYVYNHMYVRHSVRCTRTVCVVMVH